MTETARLDNYRLLGRSGLRVSPLALGTMTFGTDWGWGANQEDARQIFETYLEHGGNFIDTANHYTNGTSEQFIGSFIGRERDRLVISTKFTLTTHTGDPNSGGNHRKSMVRSVETSLRRLRTDYIDLLYLHFWDATTPIEEILRAMDDLVRSGKVLYLGISDTPAWQISRMQAVADLRGWTPLIALQIEYNLIERTAERDLIPMAREVGLAVVPWSPLADGVLAGKYTRADLDAAAQPSSVYPRRHIAAATGSLTVRGLEIAEVVKSIAEEIGGSPARVALAWTLLNPTVTSPIVGARTPQQLRDNLSSLELTLSAAQRQRLEEVSAVDPGFPHNLLTRFMRHGVTFGGISIRQRANTYL